MAPERAHHITLQLLKTALSTPAVNAILRRQYRLEHPDLHRTLFGLDFPNPVGLAAGFDKDGKHFRAMEALGFGFIELGTVTPRPQHGNPQPRLFRLPADHALINRMGFNNDGVDALVSRLQNCPRTSTIIGGNIGKNKTTPNEKATEDYVICFEKLFDHVDYFVVNVSSPNTPNLRELQDKEPLTHLLTTLQQHNHDRAHPKPILLKISPDLSDYQLDDIVDIAQEVKLAGLIATNTTISRAALQTDIRGVEKIGMGGLSGAPLRKRATEVIQYLHQKSGGQIPLVGVGGIDSPAAAQEKFNAGASLIQIYSGLVYRGPGLVRAILSQLR